ncbi:MAG: hypothetical protein R3B81_01750 [bacterium]
MISRLLRADVRRALAAAFVAGLAAAPSSGQEATEPPPGGTFPGVSGFADFRMSTRDQGDGLVVGQAEVDLEKALAASVVVNEAIAYDADSESFGLGVLSVDFRLYGDSEEHLRASETLTRSGVIVGLFDVPFGLDWQSYAAPDRPLVSAPLVVDGTHGGWNDVGAQVYAETARWSGVAFATHGFDPDHDDATIEDIRYAVGGRAGARPRAFLSVGVSGAWLVAPGHELETTLAGADVEVAHRGLSVRSEFIRQENGRAVGTRTTLDGYYVRLLGRAGDAFGVVRYGALIPEGDARTERISLGAGWKAHEDVEFRTEHQLYRSNGDNRTIFQMVVAI